MELISRWAWLLGVIGLAALGASSVIGYVTGTWDGAATYWAIAGAVSLLGYAVLDRERVGDTLSTRAFLYGSGSWLMVLLFGLIAGSAYRLSTDHDQTWDLTTDGSHTLSDHTIGVVEGLSEPVEVLAFFRNGAPSREAFSDLIGRFQEHTSALTVTYYDPLSRPRLAEENNITSDHGTVILRTADDREKRIEGDITEQKLTSKLVLLVARQEHRICWALGHGEPDPDDEFSADGLGQLVLALEELNYQVTKSLVVTQGIDAGCEVLVIARPSVDWLPVELESLAGYVASGGAVVALLDPFEAEGMSEELERYGVDVGEDIVIDTDPANMMMGVDDPSMVVLSGKSFMPHPVTSSLGAAVVLPGARSVSPLDGVTGIEVKTILESGPVAWGETDVDSEEIAPSEEERVGEVPVMVIAEVTDPSVLEVDEAVVQAAGGRLVVIGDSDFVANSHMNWGNNRDLFLNTIAWLVAEEDQIGERPSDGDMLEITAAGEAMMCVISIVLVPGAAVLLGGLTFFRRRRL